MEARRVALLFALGLAGAGASVVSASGCKSQVVNARSNFVEDGVQQFADAGWDAERIEIDNAGVTPSGGLALSATDTDRVFGTARLLAVADTEDKTSADLAILAATKTFVVSTASGVTTVRCGHGTPSGSVSAAESGCDALDVEMPSGTADKRLAVAARSGSGKVGVSFAGAQLSELTLLASNGAVDVATSTTQGATITIVSDTGDDVTLRLPRDFAADSIVLDATADKIDTSAFPDLQLGKARGEVGRGAKLISVRSGATGAVSGRIVLLAQ